MRQDVGVCPIPTKRYTVQTKLHRRDGNNDGGMRRGMNRPGKVSTDEIIAALMVTNGMLTVAAKRLRISYNTLKKYMGNNPAVREAITEIEEYRLDCAEKKLLQMIDEGNSAAVYFYLKCKGKKRGFIESPQYSPPPCHPITFKYQLVVPGQFRTGDERKLLSHSGGGIIDVKAVPNET